jgi:hypothetical protein
MPLAGMREFATLPARAAVKALRVMLIVLLPCQVDFRMMNIQDAINHTSV